MALKIFLTGATGFIGGDVAYALYSKYPDHEYAFLVRNEKGAETVRKAFSKVRIVLGGLDDSDIIENESANADVVIHTADASDHEGAAHAITRGLAKHPSSSPGFWVHTGGSGILTWEDTKKNRLGEHDDKVYEDWDEVDELTNLPDEAFHRNVDKIVLEAGKKHPVIKTVILCPGTIYGTGRGPSNTRSRQAPSLMQLLLRSQYIPIIGKGLARWNNVHVHDLADLYVLLVEAAASKNIDPEIWGEKGYLLAENGEHVWGDYARAVGKKAEELGFTKGLKEDQLSYDAAMKEGGFESVSWGLNSRALSVRARKVLAWSPNRPSIENEIEPMLRVEKSRLG